MDQALYREKRTTPEKAVEPIGDDSLLINGFGLAEPPALLAAIAERLRARDLKRLRVLGGLPFAHTRKTLLAPELADCVDRITSFVGDGDRVFVQVGLNSYLPNHFHQMPRLIAEYMTVDVCVTTVSPMDAAGYFSFGASNDYTSTAARWPSSAWATPISAKTCFAPPGTCICCSGAGKAAAAHMPCADPLQRPHSVHIKRLFGRKSGVTTKAR